MGGCCGTDERFIAALAEELAAGSRGSGEGGSGVNESRVVETFDIEIPRDRAYRLLGMHRQQREPMESVRCNFDREYAAACGLVEARAVSIGGRSGICGSAFFDAEAPIALVVCTIGSALEQRVAELTDEGRVARAMLLDAIGSAAVE